MIVCLAANPSVDRLFEVERLVKGDIHRPSSFVQVAGGKGLNVARAAAALGAEVLAVAILRGHSGRWLQEALAAEGVDGAIHREGGPTILEECRQLRETDWPDGLPTGEAAATTGGRLPARWVIHTVGPVYARSEDRSGLLASCHTESLRVADELGATTVAFPAISTGVYGYPLDEAAPVAIRAVRDARTAVREVRFVLFDREAHAAFERALSAARRS